MKRVQLQGSKVNMFQGDKATILRIQTSSLPLDLRDNRPSSTYGGLARWHRCDTELGNERLVSLWRARLNSTRLTATVKNDAKAWKLHTKRIVIGAFGDQIG